MEKLLKENSAVRTAETFVAGAAAMKLLEVGCIPLMVGVVAFIATTIWIVKSIKSGKGNLTRKAKVLMVALAAISTISLIYGIYHKLNCHNLNVADEATNEVVTEDKEPEEPVMEETEEEPTEVEASNTNTGKSTVVRGTCPVEDRIQVTYGNIGDSDSKAPNTTSSDTKIVDPAKETLKVKGEDKTEGSDCIISETGKTTPKAEEKDSEEPKTDMDKSSATEVRSEESKTEESKAEGNKAEEEKTEEVKPSEASASELDDMLKQTEIMDTTPEIEIVEVKADVFPKDTDIEENNTKDEVVEEKPELKPEEKAVTVEAIDGFTGNVNSTLQFKIEGTNVKIDGLDGIEYTFSNGILNISTGNETTVLTVEVSNSINTVTFDVIVNGVVE